ncbi:MAG: hypothetical protein CL816_01425 [Coxiellaceae bacterium]|nr:hypothetical protein [Coxiellaceae bacterium]
MNENTIAVFSVASDLAGNIPGTAEAPAYLCRHLAPSDSLMWSNILHLNPALVAEPVINQLTPVFRQLATDVYNCVSVDRRFITIGGDHSVALASWSGVSKSLREQGEPWALIWIDAHLDIHTFETSHTKNIHGMPVAGLLGQDRALMDMVNLSSAALQPEQIFYVGVRSFEAEEKQLVESLGCHVYDMPAVHARGIDSVIEEISQHLSAQGIYKIGMSIDIDALDPTVASAVTVPEDDGLLLPQIVDLIARLGDDFQMIGADLVEYCPDRDQDQQSLRCIQNILNEIVRVTLLGKKNQF